MFKNIGAYEKINFHRPNKMGDAFEDRVKWINGLGLDMPHEVVKNGWRNSRKSIGYDLVQLNHYALRSAESFLIKRNLPRMKAEFDRLLQDDMLRHWHQSGIACHRAKAEELHGIPEF